MKKGYHTYKEINTMGMSQLDLILTVYRGAINYLKQAQSSYETGKPMDGRTFCDRARRCIVHLYTTLDMEKGEGIAAQLAKLYAFMIEQLDMAMARQSVSGLGEIIDNLETIKEGWENLKERETADNQARVRQSAASQGKEPSEAVVGQGASTNEKRVTISA